MTAAEAQHSAILSLMDVVEELCAGIAAGQKPEWEWADVVAATFKQHRDELRDPEGDTA